MTLQASLAVAEETYSSSGIRLHQRILVALDSSDHANAALQSAAELAGLADAVTAFCAERTSWAARAARGPALVYEHFRLEQQVTRLVECYRELAR